MPFLITTGKAENTANVFWFAPMTALTARKFAAGGLLLIYPQRI